MYRSNMKFLQGAKVQPSRRQFLIGSAAVAGGLAIGFRTMASTPVDAAQAAASPFESYIEITSDNAIKIMSSQFDMGQGSYHGVATLAMEELGATWEQVEVIGASGNPKLFGNVAWGGAAQGTGGSTSMASSWVRYRKAGAAARMMLQEAAAKEWGVKPDQVVVKDGKLSHASGKSGTFGDFAEAASKLPVPQDVPLKPASEWTLIGDESDRRHDTAAKTNGTHDFTIDVKLPGMLTAVMIHPPKFGATVTSFDASEAKKMAGVVDVVSTPRGIAVVAEHMWAAVQASGAVSVDWDDSKAEKRGSEDLLAEYRKLASGQPKAIARSEGDAAAAIKGASKVVEATYEFPFLAHAPMEPLNAVARMNDDGTLEVWGGHQLADVHQHVSAGIAGIDPSKVKLHVMKTGGGFGRRATPDGDIAAEAVMVAKAIGFKAPVKVQWTRENDMRAGRYRPMYVHRLRAGLDDGGNIVGWEHHIVGQSILTGTPFEGWLVKDGVDGTSVEGAANLPYAIPNLEVGLTTVAVGIPVLWWRAVGSTHTAYSTEAFLDEVAKAAGKDPLALRLSLLKEHPRHVAALKLAAAKAGWGTDLPEGRAMGLSVHESFASYVAQVAEVSIEDGMPKVHRVVCAVDCGTAINPDVIKAQMEGGIGFGLGAALAEELTLVDGEVEQGNYDTYTPLRINDMPDVEVHIVSSDAPPTGVGEPGVPPIAPAVANAVAALTGKGTYGLPFNKEV